MDITILKNIVVSTFVISSIMILLFYCLSYIKSFRDSRFIEISIFTFEFICVNSFLIWVLILMMDAGDLPFTIAFLGILAVCNLGFYAILNFEAITSPNSRVDNLKKKLFLTLFFVGFLLLFVGIMIITFQENPLSAFQGIVLGIVLGFLVALIAHRQQLPKWYSLGFARARTLEEKKKLFDSEKDNQLKNKKIIEQNSFIWAYSFYSIIVIIMSYIFGDKFVENLEPSIGTATVCFFVSLIFINFILILLADKKIRKESKNKNELKNI